MKNEKKQEYVTVPINPALLPFCVSKNLDKEAYKETYCIPYIVPFFKGKDIIDYLKKYQEEHNLQPVDWDFYPDTGIYKGKRVYIAFDKETEKPVAVANTPYKKEFDKLNFEFYTVPLFKR